MKRISKRQFQRAAVRRRREARKRKRNKLAHSEAFGAKAPSIRTTVDTTSGGKSRTVPLLGNGRPVPRLLCIERDRENVLKLIYDVRARLEKISRRTPTRRDRQRLEKYQPQAVTNYWRFEDLEEITPSAALMIAAEFHRVSILTGIKFPAINISKWKPNVYTALDQIGFLELLSVKKADRRNTTNGSRRFLRFRSEELALNDVAGEMMEELENAATTLKSDSHVDFERLHGALFEGLTNTKQHAYPDGYSTNFKHVGRWWATGAIDFGERKISVVIYDQGVSIPVSITRWQSYPMVQKVLGRVGIGALSKATDGHTIAAAMEASRSSTRQPYPGLGLAEMERFMDTCTKGTLRVRSRFGEYLAEASRQPQITNHASELRGTLIEWEVWV